MQTTLTFKTPVAPNTIDEILRVMPRYKDDLNAMCEEYGYHEVVHAIYQAQDNLPKCVDWEYIEELLDEYLWNELIPEHVFAPVQGALSNLEQVLSEVCFSNKVSFWLGSDSDIRKVLEDVIKTEAEGQNGSRVVEARIRHRLKSEPDFFNEVVYGGTCDEDFNYILRCIHGSEQNLSAEEWKEECNPWMHLTTTKQVADEYYGCDELVALIPQWNCDIVHACLMGDFNKALQQNACPYSVG